MLHYNARYYDPALGTFVSPDSMVPNPARVIEYNRFLYARGNPLKYADPSGHIPQTPTGPSDDHAESAQRYWDDRWYGARGYGYDPGIKRHTLAITPFFMDMEVFTEMLADAGITVENIGGWNFEDELKYLGQGIAILARTVSGSSGRLRRSFAHLKTLVGPGVTWYRTSSKSVSFPCNLGGACAMEAGRIGFYGGLFQQGCLSDTEYHTVLRVTAIHEFAHKIHLANSPCPTNHDEWCITEEWFTDTEISMADWQARQVTHYGWSVWENWAEGVTIWVYPAYKGPAI